MKKTKKEREDESYFGKPVSNIEFWSYFIIGVLALICPLVLGGLLISYFLSLRV